MQTIPHRIRQSSEEDIPFIYNSWLKSYRKAHMNYLIPSDYYYSFYQKEIQRLMNNSQTLIVHAESDPTHIYGFLTYKLSPIGIQIAHYSYIKQPYRNMGLFGSLLKAAFPNLLKEEILATAMTKSVNYTKYKMIFNPYWRE